ncbi:MAG: hypothetical protein LBI19_10965 [Oscillospiraceae bacterium]|jgi:hypothetical protein|nr:hypothetical protein [Oscillospiraceae bacterium]
MSTARKHSNAYYTRKAEGEYQPCKNAVSVRNDFDADLFRYRGIIYEGSTGIHICADNRFAEFIEQYKGKEARYAENLQKIVSTYGLSPRYTQPKVRKADLFPPDDKRRLSKTLFQEDKSWFRRSPIDTGPELYTMEKDFMQYGMNSPLYTPCNGWMVPLAMLPLDRLDQPGFSVHGFIEAKFEALLAEPAEWIDDTIAELLGRREEADAHNLPMQQARDAAISIAERELLLHNPVPRLNHDGWNLFVHLFRENGIKLPTQTRKWVQSSLKEIRYKSDGGCSFRYSGKCDKAIGSYILKLTAAVKEKHRAREKSSVLNALGEHQKTIAAQGRASPTVKKEQPTV